MKFQKFIRRLFLAVLAIIVAIVVAGLGFWLIDGRSPQAFIVSKSLNQSTMETYEQQRGDQTDKSHVEIPDRIEFPRKVTEYEVGKMQVFECPAEDDAKPIVLYIHGGAYFHNFSLLHWRAMSEWAKWTGCGIVTPNYPLLYRYTVADAFPLLMQLYRQLQQRFPARRIILMGDSAGGGFSLALAQEIVKADSLDLPSSLILISPWVDVTGGDDTLQEYDTFLNAEVLRHVGADWAGELDPLNPMVSPLHGDMQGLPPTHLYTGTWEVFYTDILKTYDKMKAAGVTVTLHVGEKLGHVYPLWPCPEGSKARKEIAGIIE
ncbi:MAG: alpha/beta hydrolase [Bacteroidaceae bacterium]|nr:alpha/beta hydrolase [Bacteroidaceae bacterium]